MISLEIGQLFEDAETEYIVQQVRYKGCKVDVLSQPSTTHPCIRRRVDMLFETKGGYRRAAYSSPLDLWLFFFPLKKLLKNGTLSPADLANDKNGNLPRPREPLSPFSLSSCAPSYNEAAVHQRSPSSPHILAAVRFQQNIRTSCAFGGFVLVELGVVGPSCCPARS